MMRGLARRLGRLVPGFGERRRAAVLRSSFTEWLIAHRHRWHSALVADDSELGLALGDALATRGTSVLYRRSGGGVMPAFTGPGAVRMGRPQAGSFLHYLAYEAAQPSDHDLLFIDVSTGAEWPRLLRGRLRAGQTVGFRLPPGEAPPWLVEWPQPTFATDSVRLFDKLPPAWLAPVSEQKSAGIPESHRRWPRISVVTVSFNQAAYLEECLQSVLAQDYPKLEYIVVDGGSRDGSQEILERYRGRLASLTIESDDGQADGLNKGFAQATGDILTWVNSDDLLEPGALYQVALAYDAYGADLVAGGCRHVWQTREHVIVNHHTELPLGERVQLPLERLLAFDDCWQKGEFFFQPEVFFSRRAWEAASGRLRTDLSYVIDYDLWIRMARAGVTIVHIPDFLAVSRGHELQKTTSDLPYLSEVRRLVAEYAKLGIPVNTHGR